MKIIKEVYNMKNSNCKYMVAICDSFGNTLECIKCKNVDDIHKTCDLLDKEGRLYMGYIDGGLYVKHIKL